MELPQCRYCALCCGPLQVCLIQGIPYNRTNAEIDRVRERVRQNRRDLLSDALQGSPPMPGQLYYTESCPLCSDWVGDAICLGRNEKTPGLKKAFISGRIECSIMANYLIASKGDDDKFPGTERRPFRCYDGVSDDVVFPFHETCYEILKRVFDTGTDSAGIDLDILYLVLYNLTDPDKRTCLRVDYGPIRGATERWWCIPGEEYSVMYPLSIPFLSSFLRYRMQNFPPATGTKVEISDRQTSGRGLDRLPYDIFDMITYHLPGSSILAARQASRALNLSTRHPWFWKDILRRRMPWAWELEDLIEEFGSTNVNYRDLVCWLEAKVDVPYGQDYLFGGLANRKRIWEVCEQIHEQYIRWTRLLSAQGTEDNYQLVLEGLRAARRRSIQ